MRIKEKKEIQKKSLYRKCIIVVVVIVLCIAAGLIYKALTWDSVDSESQELSEAKIRKRAAELLHKDPNELTDEDFAAINDLAIEDSEITDIKLLEKFTNLQRLFMFTKGQVFEKKIPRWKAILYKFGIIDPAIRIPVDLSPLENLSNLQTLMTFNCQISHIEKLKELRNLQTLWLNNAEVSDFKTLKELVNLQILHLESTPISKLESLKDLTNLQELDLRHTQVSNIVPLKKLTNLRILNLYGTQISDLKPLEDLINMQELNLTRTQVYDIEPLKELTSLKSLYLMECPDVTYEQVDDLQKALPNLEIKR